MKKLTTLFSAISLLIFGVMFFIQEAYANPIVAGEKRPPLNNQNNQNELIVYGVIGGIVVIIIVVSIIFLNKIRKKDVNK